jgi:hypothetical protein
MQSIENKQGNTFENTTKISRQDNIKTTISCLNKLPTTADKPYSPLLAEIQKIDPNNPETNFDTLLTQIIAELNKPEVLLAVSFDLQQKDPKAYEDFKASVISLEPSFKEKFQFIEPKLKLAL